MDLPMFYQYRKGFTLIETLVVIGCIGIVVSLGMSVAHSVTRVTIGASQEYLRQLLVSARTMAMSGYDARMYGVRVTESGVVEQVSALPAATTSSLIVLMSDTSHFTHVSITGSDTTWWFYPYSGEMSREDELTITDTRTGGTSSVRLHYGALIE